MFLLKCVLIGLGLVIACIGGTILGVFIVLAQAGKAVCK